MAMSDVDVMVIGGGAAGLNGALMLARSRRSVVVVDAGQPRNAPASGVHGLIGREGIAPAELVATGRREVESYGGQIFSASITNIERSDDSRFFLTVDDGATWRARRILIATGLVDELPAIVGLNQRWGNDVLHCPYCHGWEVRDRAIGIVATSPASLHHALLFRQLSDIVVYFEHSFTAPPESSEQFAALGITVVSEEIAAVEVTTDKLSGVVLSNGTVVPCEALAVAPRLHPRVDFASGIGLHAQEHPMGVGEYVPADSAGRSAVPGVWVAGNVADPMAQVGAAAAQGAMAGAQINADLAADDAAIAVAQYRMRGR